LRKETCIGRCGRANGESAENSGEQKEKKGAFQVQEKKEKKGGAVSKWWIKKKRKPL